MRVVLQRVVSASVSVGGAIVGEIGHGLVLLVAFRRDDGPAELEWMADRLIGLRVFGDGEGKMNLGLTDVDGGLLIVSQFTLYGDARRGRRPSFVEAASPELAVPLYNAFVQRMRSAGVNVATGVFGADMQLALVNDGPVTLVIDQNAAT